MNKKTFIIIGSSILGLLVALILIVWLISVFKPHYYEYEELEEEMAKQAERYYKNNPDKLPSAEDGVILSYDTLVSGEYMIILLLQLEAVFIKILMVLIILEVKLIITMLLLALH